MSLKRLFSSFHAVARQNIKNIIEMEPNQPEKVQLGKRTLDQMLQQSVPEEQAARAPEETPAAPVETSEVEKKDYSEQGDPYGFYKSIGSPQYFVAPMVDQSELPYRMLTRKYGAHVCYTPMYHARLFSTSPQYRENMFTPCAEDRPLIVQFCANDPDILLNAAKYVEDHCDAVDINLGCPQGIAKKGNYGSFLLEKTDLITSMVRKLKENLKVPVVCKIRCLPREDDTLHLAREIQKAGASWLAVHGRTREHNKQTVGPANYSIIRRIKNELKIPVILNGGISNFDDVKTALKFSGCDGVMSSEAILEYPALYHHDPNSEDGGLVDMDDLALEYFDMYTKYPGEANPKIARAHLHKFLHGGFVN